MEWPLSGLVAPGFEALLDAFRGNFDDPAAGVEIGAAFCAIHHGRCVANLWGGYQDAGCTRPWRCDTLVNVYSTIKGPAAAALAVLVDAGLLDYEAPVAHYWPELRAARSGLRVSQLLAHQAGLCGLREPLTVVDLYDWDAMCRRLERQTPLWTPGTATGYHAVTWGFLAGELARRAGGVALAELLQTRLAGPLNAACYVGLPEPEWHRAADLVGPNRARRPLPQAESGESAAVPALKALAMTNPLIRPYADACSDAWRRAELAASNGHASAAGLARLYAALAGGGALDGVRVLSASTVEALRAPQGDAANDLVLGYPMRRGRGVNLNTRGEFGPGVGAFGHTGSGGSLGFADAERGLGVGYVMNQLWDGTGPASRSGRLVAALYGCLDAAQ